MPVSPSQLCLLIKSVMQSPFPRRHLSLQSDGEYIWCFLPCPTFTACDPFEQSLLLRNPVILWHSASTRAPIPSFFLLAELNCKSRYDSVKALTRFFLIPLLLRDSKTLRKCSQPQLSQASDQISSLLNNTWGRHPSCALSHFTQAEGSMAKDPYSVEWGLYR